MVKRTGGNDRLTVFGPAAAHMPRVQTTLQVLLVEDSASDADIVATCLADALAGDGPRFSVRRVDRLAEASRVLSDVGADVVLLDLSLPDGEGLDSLAAILAVAPDVPVVVVTGLADDAVALQAVRAGAQDYLVKGRDDDRAIRRAIRYAVERQHLMLVARRAVRARDEVLAIVSHDLRNPLGTLTMCIEALLDPYPLPPDRARHLLEIGRRSTASMGRLIEDLLDVSRLDAARLQIHPERVTAAAVVSTLATMHGPAAGARGVTLASHAARGLPWIHADHDRLLQALGNLVGNAIKFTPAGGHVTVRAEPADDASAGVRFTVADTGQGIDAAKLPYVFDRFSQARDARRGGAGLGLAIARGLVEAQGGLIWAESRAEGGARVSFTLPSALRHRG